MEEEEARLALLQTELNNIQNGMRNFDSIILQIKGWCVTTSLAVGGFAVAYHKPALLLVGGGAIIGFFMINCQFRMFQREYIRRNLEIDSELKSIGIMQVLKGAGNVDIVGTATHGQDSYANAPISERVRIGLPDFWYEIHRPSNFSLYIFVSFCLLLEALILLL